MKGPSPGPSHEQMQDMFRAHTDAALKVIVEIMNGSGGKGDAVRLSAAKEILNRAWGKPMADKKAADKKTADKKTGERLAEGPQSGGAADEQDAPATGKPQPWFRASPAAAKPNGRDLGEGRERHAATL